MAGAASRELSALTTGFAPANSFCKPGAIRSVAEVIACRTPCWLASPFVFATNTPGEMRRLGSARQIAFRRAMTNDQSEFTELKLDGLKLAEFKLAELRLTAVELGAEYPAGVLRTAAS